MESLKRLLKDAVLKTAFVYLLVTLLLALTGVVYTVLGYGRHSDHMSFMFVPSLVSAAFFALVGGVMRKNPIDSSALFIGHFGIAAITVGMLLSGIFDIAGYGVPDYMPAYYAAGAGLCMVCFILTVILTDRKRKKSAETADDKADSTFSKEQ